MAPGETANASSRDASQSRLLSWFIHPRITEATLRQRHHVFLASHLAGAVFGLLLMVVLYAAAPINGGVVAWLAAAVALFALFPFILKATGRLDIMGAVSALYFAAIVLIISHYFGGLLSPALVWMVMAVGTAIYYLGPWPRWRAVNLIAQGAMLTAFVVAHATGTKPGLDVPADTLLTIGLISSCAVVAFMSAITLQIWTMDLAKHRELEHEMAVRRSVETDLKRTAEELLRRRDHLVQSQRVGKIGSAEIVYWPQHTAVWSEELYSLFDRDPGLEAFTGDEFLAHVHPDDRSVVRNYRERESRGDYPRASEFRIVRPDGDHRWIRRQAEPIEWRDGVPSRAIAIYLDVTEQKDAQQAVVDLEEQLSQAHKMEAIGQLTGGVAHDFNNLLAVLLGRLQMINEELADGAGQPPNTAMLRDWIGSCIKAVDRGATLTKSMLAFSRQQALMPVALDVNSVISDMEDMLRRALGETYRLVFAKDPS
ncbi:MAG TPA: PAS domain-containing protein, partial [Hyphomonadaceae bacterium]|nr:PAS domain-containing protein [Hyphomonadaceae bacterium]